MGAEEPAIGGLGAAPPDVRRGVVRDVMLTFSGRVALTAVILVADVIVARTLGPEGKGAFALVLNLASLGALLLSLGLDRSLAVIGARSVAIARVAFANAAWWTLVVGALGVIAILALYGAPEGAPGEQGLLATVMPRLSGPQLLLAALTLPAEIAYAIGTVGLLGHQRVWSYNIWRFLRRGLLLVLLVGFVLVARLDLTGLLVLNLVVVLVTAGGIGWAMARAKVVGWRPDARLLIEQLSFGGRAFVGTIAERLHYRADGFLLTALVSVSATGVYSVAQGLAETMWYVPNAFGLVLFSRAVRPGSDSAGIASAMTRSVLALGVALAVPLWFVAPALVEIVYGAPFSEAGTALQVMLPGVVAYSVVAVLTHFVIASGAPGRAAAVAIAGLALNLGSNLVLIPALGMIGAAASESLSYSCTAVMMLLLYRSISGRGIIETVLIRRTDLSARSSELRALLRRSEPPRA